MSPNGVLALGGVDPTWFNGPLPTSHATDAVLAFWDDQILRQGVCTATFGTAPDRRFVVEWADAFFYHLFGFDPFTHMSFEVVLSEATGAIDVLYGRMTGWGQRPGGSSATIGLQRDTGSWYDLVAYNLVGSVGPGWSIQWVPGCLARCNAVGTCVP